METFRGCNLDITVVMRSGGLHNGRFERHPGIDWFEERRQKYNRLDIVNVRTWESRNSG